MVCAGAGGPVESAHLDSCGGAAPSASRSRPAGPGTRAAPPAPHPTHSLSLPPFFLCVPSAPYLHLVLRAVDRGAAAPAPPLPSNTGQWRRLLPTTGPALLGQEHYCLDPVAPVRPRPPWILPLLGRVSPPLATWIGRPVPREGRWG